jgi:hypothetical protein
MTCQASEPILIRRAKSALWVERGSEKYAGKALRRFYEPSA